MSVELSIKSIFEKMQKKNMFERCDDSEIRRQEKYFFRTFGLEMPESYKSILKLSNGLKYKDLVIYPVTGSKNMTDSIYEINENMTPQREFVAFAQLKDNLYAYDNAINKYVQMEYSGSNWKIFESSDEMFNFILEQTLNDI